MKITSFRIKNYRGVNDTTIKLTGNAGSIYTLVGLNESGKTTILEAINHFSTDVDGVHAMAQGSLSKLEKHSLVPKKLKDNFNGEISIAASVEIDDDDWAQIKKKIKLQFPDLQLEESSLTNSIGISKRNIFEASKYKSSKNTWSNFNPVIRYEDDEGVTRTRELGADDAEWQGLAEIVRLMLPRIVFFPTFLFEFPEKIQISEGESEVEGNEYFRLAIKDALASLNPPLDLETHVVDRVRETKKDLPFPTFMGTWFGSDESEQVDTVLAKLSSKLTEEIFGRWKEVLGSDIGDKTIDLRQSIEPGSGAERKVFLTFNVKDGFSRFKVSERSLGFRWFFCFLLFTRFFRQHDGGKAIFLFDEPASNLHSLAQSKLLDSLQDIANSKNDIIYSTHSHYLVNPLWLETAYIVSNGDLVGNDGVIDTSFGVEDVDIKVKRYKTFVGENSEKGHYFQPILDRLRIQPSLIQAVNGGVIVEGKSDFYILNWFKKYHSPDSKLQFVPVGSASKGDALISLYLGLGKDFVFLLDNDGAGQSSKDRYLKGWPVSEEHFVSLSEPFDFKVKAIESLLSAETKKSIREHYGSGNATKKLILRAFSESLSGSDFINASDETVLRLRKLFLHLEKRLELGR